MNVRPEDAIVGIWISLLLSAFLAAVYTLVTR